MHSEKKSTHGEEHVDQPLVLHPLQHLGQGDEHPRPPHARAAVHCDGPVLPKLLLRLVHLGGAFILASK